MEPRGAQEIESGGGEGDEPAPQVHGERRVGAGKSCDKVIFKGRDGALSKVRAMHVRGHQLERDAPVREVLFECAWALVVEDLDFWGKSFGGK